MAKRGGTLPAFEDLEALRVEAEVPVRRFLRRLGIPSSTWYHWRGAHLNGRTVRRWPAPIVDAIEERAAQEAHKWSAWGHRKIHAMLRADGIRVSASSVKRALGRRGLLQPVRYQSERRQLAKARHATFWEPPRRRNRVWQTDFTEFETTTHGTWRIAGVVDYFSKLCLAAPVSGTQTAKDAIGAIRQAMEQAEALLGGPLIDDCVDLYREEIPDAVVLGEHVERYREIYNGIRPHEALKFLTPMAVHLAEPNLFEPEKCPRKLTRDNVG